MKIKLLKLSLFILLAFIFVSPTSVNAGYCVGHPDITIEPECVSSGFFWESGAVASSTPAADQCATLTDIGKIICKFHQLLNSIVPVLIALGVVYFVFGVVQYVIGDEGEAKKKGRDRIVFGIIGLGVIIGLWGLVNVVTRTFGFSGQSVPSLSSLTPGGASTCVGITGIGKIICEIHQILKSLIPVLITLGVLYFVWGVVQYVIGDDGEAKKKGKDGIIYGIIGLAVIVGVWGLVNIVVTTFGVAGTMPTLPTAGTTTGAEICPPMGANPKLQNLLTYFTCLINKSIIPFIFALAMVMFVWGVVQFVINSAEEAKKEKGRQFMIWGIIALTVMVSVWGLVNVVGGTFGLENVIPQVKP